MSQQCPEEPVGTKLHTLSEEISSMSPGRAPAVGYIRMRVKNKPILFKAIIDSGNLAGDLISEDLATQLKLPITGNTSSVGTAAAGGSVTLLGKTPLLHLHMEGIKNSITIQPSVVRNLAHHMNLGQSFLREHQADMTFRPCGIQLNVQGSTATLIEATAKITRSSIDTRVTEVLCQWKRNGGNPGEPHNGLLDLRESELQPGSNQPKLNQISTSKGKTPTPTTTSLVTGKDFLPGLLHSDKKKIMVWAKTGRAVFIKGGQMIEPQCHAVITATLRTGQQPVHQNNSVLIQPKQTCTFLNTKGLFVHPGTYRRIGDQVNILVTNFGKTSKKIPTNLKIGRMYEGIAYAAPTINALDHRPTTTLNTAEQTERVRYLTQTLKLTENPLLKDRPIEQEKLIQIFLQNWDALALSDTDYGRSDAMRFHIKLEPGASPAHSRVRPLNPYQEEDLKKQLDEWEKKGIIEKSMSPWASALVPCKKKGSTELQWAVDFRKVNELTIKEQFPLEPIDNNMHELSGSTVFSCLDAIGAFHSLIVDEKSRDITSFVSPFGSYRFVRLPFGLSNAPSAYSKLVQMALSHLPCGFTLAYIDDVIVHSPTVEKHLEHVEQVLQLHAKFGMKLRLNRCTMFQSEIEYLGHLVSKEGIKMIPSYVDRILSWNLPKTGKDLQTFLGFTGYYKSFIKEYSSLTSELNKARKNNYIDWTDKMKNNFEELKNKFETGPVRGYPDYKNPEPFILDTDFSAINMAAVLSQKQQGKEVFLGCVAQKCNQAQQSYPSHKGELCAVALGLQRFEHILRYRPFIIRTDSSCIKHLNTMKEYRGMFAKIQAFLAGFEYIIDILDVHVFHTCLDVLDTDTGQKRPRELAALTILKRA